MFEYALFFKTEIFKGSNSLPFGATQEAPGMIELGASLRHSS